MMLVNGLNRIIDKNGVSFHMPGHKNGRYLQDNFPKNWLAMDITEITGADNLMDPTSIILESQMRASRIYHARKTKFLVNGSTSGIEAMILGSTKPGDRVLVNRNAHQSIFNALILADVDVAFIPMKTEEGIITDIDEHVFMDEIKRCNAVILTYPTYEGVCMDIKKYIDIAHHHKVPVLVDAAHGAHLTFNDDLPACPINAGADVVVMSLHKTLPAMTQTAIIHYSNDLIDEDQLLHFLKTFQSSSPSYVLMSSIDLAMKYCEENKDDFDKWLALVKKYRSSINKIGKFYCFESSMNYDETKILLMTKKHGYSGYEVGQILENDYNIFIEYANDEGCLLMTSPVTSTKDFEHLIKALKSIPQKLSCNRQEQLLLPAISEMKMGLRQAFYHRKSVVPLENSVGRISASNIIAYPPGIPLLVPGEIITDEHRRYIELNKSYTSKIIGLDDDGHIKVIE